ncbi:MULTISPECIES: ABC transporter substrate-binding protein [unclassified Rathayibacter]|uniref:ABC transporter substrate-binding protein n=1 Tax=unclassified Rathayibacter TaxID=2609250 RepID=UPI000CE805F8|nr:MULTISPECIES: extracellular solute-binding protein [unclassified Rathayibacter]PPF15062.1 sugar ABC transporter substrate-binding protein [Rathayibacter sp. AY1A4]PPG81536.1 sugar ABC transporter substrate-binding protein [Rathayibacter sp. AY1E5]PPH32208.1 sugar ABC transporter substrate-binding protein [Rathayibacter sp. AY1C3]PPH66314.1 sugar ABC transporter substrate-binding protein [Rathayibacter sp. AY1D7]PPI31266.1 sugar ABC transporter substrate-binding protein [Rathayibacter sp. AY
MSFPTPGTPIGRRTVLVGAGSVAALFTLAACAPGGSSAPAASSSVDVSTELTSDTVELVIADETGFPVTDKLTEEFTKQFPNVTFTINRDTFANLTANSPKLLASDTPPDLIRLPTIGDTVKDGLLADLDPWFDAYGWDAWSASQLAPLRVDSDGVRGKGSLYQLGLGYSVTGIYMNLELAKQLGIDAPPTTLAEFEEDLAKAKAGGVLPIMAGDKDGVVNFVVQAAMNQYADKQEMADWIFTVPGATYETDGNVKGAELVRTWADAGYFPSDINAIDYSSFVSRFQGGEGLFAFNGNWAAADTQTKMGDGVDFFLVPPAEEGGSHVAMGAANSFSVAAKSSHLNEIVFFLNWIHTNEAARQIVVDVTGAAPGGDPAQALPEVESGSLLEQALAMSAQIGAEDGQVDFMSNATAGIYAGAIIPESQLLVTSQISGQDFVTAVQEFYAKELAG